VKYEISSHLISTISYQQIEDYHEMKYEKMRDGKSDFWLILVLRWRMIVFQSHSSTPKYDDDDG